MIDLLVNMTFTLELDDVKLASTLRTHSLTDWCRAAPYFFKMFIPKAMIGVERPMMDEYLSILVQLRRTLNDALRMVGKAMASVMMAEILTNPPIFERVATFVSLSAEKARKLPEQYPFMSQLVPCDGPSHAII